VFAGDSQLLSQKRHLITGGAGLVGSHIADLLVKAGASEIVIIDNFSRGTRENLAWASHHGKVNIIEGDICDINLLNEHMAGIDTVFHEAAIRITQCAEEPRLAHDVLATGTYNVLEAAVKAGVRKLIAASSASIYGLAEQFPTTEIHHPYNNDTLYGAAKVYLEGMLRSFHAMYGLDYVALRYFNTYGPRMDTHGKYTEVFVRWMERIHGGNPPVIFGDGEETMDFVFVEDNARANLLAAQADVTDEVFNVASGTEINLKSLARALMQAMNVDLEIEFQPRRTVYPATRRLADVGRAKELMGFEAAISLDEGLRRLVDWWLSKQAKE
jgi:UDP-glucose 4-epimerase